MKKYYLNVFAMIIVNFVFSQSNLTTNDKKVELAPQIGSNVLIETIAISNDEKYLLSSGGSKGSVIVWDLKKNIEVKQLKELNNRVTSICFSNDGKYFAIAGGSYTTNIVEKSKIIIYNSKDFSVYKIIEGLKPIKYLKFSKDGSGLYFYYADEGIKGVNTLLYVSIKNGKIKKIYTTPNNFFIHKLFVDNNDENIIISLRKDYINDKLCIYNMKNRELHVLSTSLTTDMDISKDGTILVVSKTGTVQIYDIVKKRMIKTLNDNTYNLILSVRISTDNKYVYVATMSDKINNGNNSFLLKKWDISNESIRKTIHFDSYITDIKFFGNAEKFVISGGNLNKSLLSKWSVETDKELNIFGGYVARLILDAEYDPINKRIIVASSNADALYFINLKTLKLDKRVQLKENSLNNINLLKLTDDYKKLIITGTLNDMSYIYALDSSRIKKECKNKNNILLSHDNTKLVFSEKEYKNKFIYKSFLKSIDIDLDKEIQVYNTKEALTPNPISFSADDKFLLVNNAKFSLNDGIEGIDIYDVNSSKPIYHKNIFKEGLLITGTCTNKDNNRVLISKSIYISESDSTKKASIFEINLSTQKEKKIFTTKEPFVKDLLGLYNSNNDDIYISYSNPVTNELVSKIYSYSDGVVSDTNFIIAPQSIIENGKYIIGYYSSNISIVSTDYLTEENLVKLYFMKNSDDILAITNDNYYYTSKNGLMLIKYRVNGNIYPPEQFDLKYNRPDIVLSRLGYADSTLIKAYHRAYLKRIKKMGFKEEELNGDFHIPESKIINFEYLPTTTDSSDIGLDLHFEDSKYKLDRINIWINNVAIYGINGIDLRAENVSNIDKNIKLELLTGDNKIQVSCLNQKGAESYKETVNIAYKPKQETKPNLYLVTIGTSKYKDERFNLEYAAKDAQDVANLFKEDKYFDKVIIKTLTNEQVTKESIAKLKNFFNQASRNDQVIVFVAGHGVLDANLDYYLASNDMDFNYPDKRGISYEELENVLDGIKPLKKILFVDACHSGEIDKEEMKLAEAANTKVGDVVFRSAGAGVVNKTNNLGLKNTSELTKELFTDLRRGTGATVVSSAGGGEYAMESGEWKNGLFTYSLINGIKSKKADLNKDGKIMLSELQKYVQSQVLELSDGKQQPTSRIENISMDFRVW